MAMGYGVALFRALKSQISERDSGLFLISLPLKNILQILKMAIPYATNP